MARFPILSDGTDATPERVADILATARSYATDPEGVHPTVREQIAESVDRNYRHERSFLLALVGAEAGAAVIAADLRNRGIITTIAEVRVAMTAAGAMLS